MISTTQTRLLADRLEIDPNKTTITFAIEALRQLADRVEFHEAQIKDVFGAPARSKGELSGPHAYDDPVMGLSFYVMHNGQRLRFKGGIGYRMAVSYISENKGKL